LERSREEEQLMMRGWGSGKKGLAFFWWCLDLKVEVGTFVESWVRQPTNKGWKATMLGRDPTKHLYTTFTCFEVAKT
jgi:hypothetical protein